MHELSPGAYYSSEAFCVDAGHVYRLLGNPVLLYSENIGGLECTCAPLEDFISTLGI